MVRQRFVGVFVAMVICAALSSVHAQVMIPTPPICKTTGPGDWEWWLHGCWQYPSIVVDELKPWFAVKPYVVR